MKHRQIVLAAEPDAMLDYYELLRGQGEPCWFIRRGIQGEPISQICASPRAAWKSAHTWLPKSLRKQAA
jgi:hypothetical protein